MILENKIEIHADRERVWQVTIDVESWPLWSPAMQKIVREDSGDFILGSSALIKQNLMPETRWVVTALNPGHSFSWQTKVLGIQMEASHLITASDSGVTSVLKIEMKGGVAKLLWPLMKTQVLRALKEENAGLKQFCEARS
jgi:hypothetical protein